jgi:hypothetical protein
MSKPDISSVTEKQEDLSKIDDILKGMTNNVDEGKTFLNQPSAIEIATPMPPTGG